MKKRDAIIMLMRAVLCVVLFLTFSEVGADKEVTFPDESLEKVIRGAIEKESGPIYASDLEEIVLLNAERSRIRTIQGLEYCTNLRYLNLSKNNIYTIVPLSPLTNLVQLDLSSNNIRTISPLSTSTKLKVLDLSHNKITTISPLIDNLGLSEGNSVNLAYNPLIDETQISKLRKRGVSVKYLPSFDIKEVKYLPSFDIRDIIGPVVLSLLIMSFFLRGCIYMLLKREKSKDKLIYIQENRNDHYSGYKEDYYAGDKEQCVRIIVLYDDSPSYREELTSDHGFSCLVKGTEKTILFDTGRDGSILLNNMKALGIDPQDIDIVVISHAHEDHIGGLYSFLDVNPRVTVYLLTSFSEEVKHAVRVYGTRIEEVYDVTELCESVYSTGECDTEIKEQSLLIRTEEGMIVITGCAHVGITDLVRETKEFMREDVFFVMGGFHLQEKSEVELKKIASEFKKMSVQYVGPCHCSGDLARKLFRCAYKYVGPAYSWIDVGTWISFRL